MHLGLTGAEWRRLHVMNGLIISVLFIVGLVVAPMGFYPGFAIFTGILGVLGLIISGGLYIASVLWQTIRPVVYVATLCHCICPMIGAVCAGLVLQLIRQLF